MRYFIHLAYLGTAYSGWQRQATTSETIQQKLETALSLMLSKSIFVCGCGRTDAGVHAMQYFGHFDYDEEWRFDPLTRINKMLPPDITVFDIMPMDPQAHSRNDALGRSYIYHFHTRRNAYLWPFSAYYELDKIDLTLINDGLELLKGLTDFRHLCGSPDKMADTLCSLSEASLYTGSNGDEVIFKFTANRFLKYMVRMMVGRLIELAAGRLSIERFQAIIKGDDALPYPVVAYPQGLHLFEIKYPYLVLPCRHNPFADWMSDAYKV